MKMIILLWDIFLLVNNKFFPIFERWIKPFRKKEGKNFYAAKYILEKFSQNLPTYVVPSVLYATLSRVPLKGAATTATTRNKSEMLGGIAMPKNKVKEVKQMQG